jgi:hypothetical protein
MYESRHQPLLAKRVFFIRVAVHLGVAIFLVVASLGIGMAGYMGTEHMPAMDAFLNAAMLLGGMGPITPLATDGGKLFAGLFALYAGLIFIVCAALVLTPLFHRILHRFHIADRD